MLLRHHGGPSVAAENGAAARVLQLLPEELDAAAANRALSVARALKGAGGEMVIAGGPPRLEIDTRRAGIDHRPYASTRASLFHLSATQALLDTVDQRRLQLVHVHGSAGGLAAKAFAEAANLPLVMTCETLPQAAGLLRRRAARKHISGRPVIVRSAYAAECLRRDFSVPEAAIRVIPPGIDLEAFDESRVGTARKLALLESWGLHDDPRPLILLPVASADPSWLATVLAAAAAPDAPDAVWMLLGAAQDAAAARARISGSPAASRVAWAEMPDDWPAACKLASLVVSLPVHPPLICEHALAAQAMGRPVITSDAGAGAETIQPGKTGWLVRARDPGSLVYAVSGALERDDIIRTAMSMAARSFVAQRFSIARMQAETLAVYRETLAARKLP
ncbi:glycosyltransferase [Rhodobacteraceae bacterium 2CG4]|uniref:Glycosyltransferase n=1 Tax=Halovulum marinum TaxID=2662447 RepID=A0A6L5YXY3_9RHOB|nr:glycosyltransferase [Halovulum marinum]MSU88675.1 glycosyltransferase [Halovulum marinum]